MNWEYKIRVKHLLEEDKDSFTKEEIQEKTAKFWKCIKSKHYSSFMADFIDEFEFFYPTEVMEDVEMFDELLSHLYDYCDYNSVWVD
jgi:hypothetical protein